MTPRGRRLIADLEGMKAGSDAGRFSFRSKGEPPEEYQVEVARPGLEIDGDRIAVRNLHRFRMYLHRNYPRRPPVVKWQTPVFHPNLLGPERNGGVCIGDWSASESLADLVVRLTDLVTYGSFSTDDALDTDAAAWVHEHGIEPGCDLESIVDREGSATWKKASVTTR